MSCSKSTENSETIIPSKKSRFAFVPILHGRTNSAVSDRIISALKDSSFCSSNPIVKKLLLQNVHVWCIVIETSGTQSIRVICASVPYLLRLLARANPKVKQILEDEKVASYVKFFQETDMESVLASLCTATVIIQKGIQMCQPTLCVQLSRDALMFGNNTLKTLLTTLYNGIISAFMFLWEDLGPAFQSFCSRNREFVKYITANLPVFALASAKSLVLFSFFVRRVFQYGLKLVKLCFKFIYNELKESSLDITLVQLFQSLTTGLRNLISSVLSKHVYQYCKCLCISSSKWCINCLKEVIPIVWQECLKFIRNFLPFLKKYIRLVIQSSSTTARLLEEYIKRFIKMVYNSRSSLQNFLQKMQPYFIEFSQIVISLIRNIVVIARILLPDFIQMSKYFLKTAIHACTNLIHIFSFIRNYVSNLLDNVHEVNPALKYVLSNLLEIIGLVSNYLIKFNKLLYNYILQVTPTLYGMAQPFFLPISKEIHSTVNSCSNEIISKSYSGVKIVVPSLWQAITTVSPPTFYATHDICMTSTKAICIIYPTVVSTIVTIHPDVSKAVVIVLKDSSRAFLEVSTVSYSASSQLCVAAKNFSKELPVALCAVNKVAVEASNAFIEVSSTSSKAQDRMLKDFKRGVTSVRSSLKSAELEFISVIDEIMYEIKDTVSDSPNLLELVRKGLVLNLYVQKRISEMLCTIYSHISINIQNEFNTLKEFYCTLKKHIFKYLSNYLFDSSDVSSVFSMCLFYHSNLIYTNLDNYLRNILNKMLSVNQFIMSSSVSKDFKELISQNLSYVSIFIKKYASVTMSEVMLNIIPRSWNLLKCVISSMWEKFCKLTNKGWMQFEQLSAETWSFIYENFPELWDSFKTICESVWIKTCEHGPSVWEYTLTTAPVLWSYNCFLVKSAWDIYVEICSKTWNLAVPLSSYSWAYTLHICPKLWLSISENSKTNWELFCFASENSWESVTYTSSTSWSILNKIVSKSWHCGIRQVTTTVCFKTSSLVANGIKISYRICAKTGKIVYFIFDELSAVNYPMIKFEKDSSTKRVQCPLSPIDFSTANSIHCDSKINLLKCNINKLLQLRRQVSDIYSDYLKIDKMIENVCAIPKLSLIPVSLTLSQNLVKKYYSLLTSYKNVYLPPTEMFPVVTTFNVE